MIAALAARTSFSMLLLCSCAALLGAAPAPRAYSGTAVDISAIVPPAPLKGDARYAADRAVFKRMRKLVDQPRWQLAVADIPFDVRSVLGRFSCACGASLSPETTPVTFSLLSRATADVSAANNLLKNRFQRERPFRIDRGQTCQSPADLDRYDYPSGHAARGWAIGTILAELIPERAAAILARARAFGESRLVCRVHNMSAVEAGRLSASSTLTVLRTFPEYQSDFAAARRELMETEATPGSRRPDDARCAAEATLIAQPILR